MDSERRFVAPGAGDGPLDLREERACRREQLRRAFAGPAGDAGVADERRDVEPVGDVAPQVVHGRAGVRVRHRDAGGASDRPAARAHSDAELEILCERLEKETRFAAISFALRKLVAALRGLGTPDKSYLSEWIVFARQLFGRVMAGESPQTAPPPASRREFWK